MKFTFILTLILGLVLVSSAQACWRSGDLERFNKKIDTTFSNFDVVFIGTLIEVKDHKEFIFKIEKGIKNAKEGENYTARLGINETYCSFIPKGGLFFYVHRPDKEVPPIPPISKEFLEQRTHEGFTSEQIQSEWEWDWKAKFAGGNGTSLIRVGGRYYPSDAAFIKEKFGYDITVGATDPQPEKE